MKYNLDELIHLIRTNEALLYAQRMKRELRDMQDQPAHMKPLTRIDLVKEVLGDVEKDKKVIKLHDILNAIQELPILNTKAEDLCCQLMNRLREKLKDLQETQWRKDKERIEDLKEILE